MTTHLLNLADFDSGQVRAMLDLAIAAPDDLGRPLAGGGAALLFEKPSNRTRQSTEMAVFQLGGHPIYTRAEEVGIDTREPAEDVVRILAGYHRVIAARVFEHGLLERMAAVSTVPIVNLLSDHSHPLQALADALTMEAEFGSLEGRKVAWIGDYNNVARSLGEVVSLLGGSIAFGCPNGFGPEPVELERFVMLGALEVTSSERAIDAARGAEAIHADTWVSMGQEDEKSDRVKAFEGFAVNEALMAAAQPAAIFMHCMPAYRGIEVTADVIDGPQSRVFPQGHNRLAAARGAIAYLLGAHQ